MIWKIPFGNGTHHHIFFTTIDNKLLSGEYTQSKKNIAKEKQNSPQNSVSLAFHPMSNYSNKI